MGKKRNVVVIIDSLERERSILQDTPALFEIERDPKAIKWDLWDEIRTFNSYGKKAIQKHDEIILKKAEKYNLDPDLIRTIMYAENARGHKMIVNQLADKVDASKSILPMNIQKNRWSSIIDKKPDDMYHPDVNIEASAVLLKRIMGRIKKPTPEKIGTVWNDLSADKTNVFGEYIGKTYHEKPWGIISED